MTDSTEVEWVEFVPEKRSVGKPPAYGYEVLDALKANPGSWAKLWTYDVKGSAWSAKGSLVKKGYQAEVRGWVLYAMWPGDDFTTPSALKHHVARQHPEGVA